MPRKIPRPPKGPQTDPLSEAKKYQQQVDVSLQALLRRYFPKAPAEERRRSAEYLAFALFTLKRGTHRQAANSTTLARADLLTLDAALGDVLQALRNLSPRASDALVGAVVSTADKTGVEDSNRSPVNLTPTPTGFNQTWMARNAIRQLRTACVGARRHIVPVADKQLESEGGRFAGSVPGLDEFVQTIRPIWVRNSSGPFNGSYKASLAHGFVRDVLAIGGFDAKPVSVINAARLAAKHALVSSPSDPP
jgi:hypothetical protein